MSYDPVRIPCVPTEPYWCLVVVPIHPRRPVGALFSQDDLHAAAQWCASHDYLGAEPPPERRAAVAP